MLRFVKNYIDTCEECQRNKSVRHKPFGQLQPLNIPNRPWKSISLDFIVKLPPSKGLLWHTEAEFDSILVVVDRATKMACFIPCNESMTAFDLALLYFHYVFPYFGIPQEVVSDRGTLFTSAFIRSLCELTSIEQNLSSAFHPQTDGQTERVNQVLEQYLRIFVDYDQAKWVQLLPTAAFAYNNSFHESIKMSPFYANYGYNPTFQVELKDVKSPDAKERIQYIHTLHEILQHEIANAQKAFSEHADKKRLSIIPFKEGDKVWLLRRNIKTTRPSEKLDYKRLGPFKVLKVISNVVYKLQLPSTIKIHLIFYISLLEPFKTSELRPELPPPPPIVIKGEEEWQVEKILSTKLLKIGRKKKRRERH